MLSEAVIKLPVVVLLWQRCSVAAKWESPPGNIVRHMWNTGKVCSVEKVLYMEKGRNARGPNTAVEPLS